jgi:cytochrome P450
MKDPAAYHKLQTELDRATEEGVLGPIVQYNEAIKLPYLGACIKEAMRLHPSVGLTMPRIAPVGGLSVGGHTVPEGYNVGMNAAVVHRDVSVFGPDPDVFRPERWLAGDGDSDEKASSLMGRSLLYFGAGTRTCIGKNVCPFSLPWFWPTIV